MYIFELWLRILSPSFILINFVINDDHYLEEVCWFKSTRVQPYNLTTRLYLALSVLIPPSTILYASAPINPPTRSHFY